MEIYPFSISQKYFEEAQLNDNWNPNYVLNYSINQALEKYPNHIIKEIKYQRIKNGTEDPTNTKCDEHRWNIILERNKIFIRGNLNEP